MGIYFTCIEMVGSSDFLGNPNLGVCFITFIHRTTVFEENMKNWFPVGGATYCSFFSIHIL